jgi:type IV secretory pathway VirB10-like protein
VAASSSGSRSLLRTGGIALLGVGIIAATVGLFTSVTGGNDAGTAVPSASSQALPATAAPVTPVEPAPTAPAAPPTEAAPAPEATAPAVPDGAAARSAPPAAAEPAPGAPAPAPAPVAPAPAPAAGSGTSGSGSDGAGVRAPLRVYNNSLIQGLAAKAKSDFEAAGWTVTAISGYGEGVVDHSTVYFRPGTSEEAAAQELGREFGLRVEPRFPGIAQSSEGVIVIVTQDYKPIGTS